MDTTNIPKSVTVADTNFGGTYTSTKDPQAATWSWYPPLAQRDTWPHVTVGMGDDVDDTIQLTGFDGSTSTLKKLWWYKLHVSVDISGRNLQMYYKISANWTVSPCGNTMQHIPSHNQAVAQKHANRQATDYKQFAQAFVTAAREGWKQEKLANLPARGPVGPQTAASFNNGDGL